MLGVALEGWEVEDVVGVKVDWMALLLFCTDPDPDPVPVPDHGPSSGPGCCRATG